MELFSRMEQVRLSISEFTSAIDSMKLSRDAKLSDIENFQSEFEVCPTVTVTYLTNIDAKYLVVFSFCIGNYSFTTSRSMITYTNPTSFWQTLFTSIPCPLTLSFFH